ncbi:DUF3800 domain-containing protein [Stenotrophomonas geniculata]|uniref:DUF3800 domain-containing protein n=1 Tax=Stenotrophomonas geniculata N1 TaxID=1167641 RepID=A0A0L8A6K8_9GAMM|nr:DUF3800 domain-containing protein [Stenotrophomonas geniculata]KOE97856.1 hypothetical protein W7K_18045 [Stenotrophomonas geniculata N1]
MYFHIDESGNTGNDLFNRDQPKLSYGVISSRTNVDALGVDIHRQMLRKAGRGELHAKNLRANGIIALAPMLEKLQDKMKFDFDFYFIEKETLAIILFFDAVFDAGINPAVRWENYWTPMRFIIIHKLAYLMDDSLLRKAWDLCTTRRIEPRAAEIVALLKEIKSRALATNWDIRSKEVIADALSYGMKNPLALDFGQPDRKLVSPNAVGFQFVVSSIARRLRNKCAGDASKIVVDRQTEFNEAQIKTHQVLKLMHDGMRGAPANQRLLLTNHPLYMHMAEGDLLGLNLPGKQIDIANSEDSIGLQIVDIYLWIAQKFLDRKLPPALFDLARKVLRRSYVDGISMTGMQQRYEKFEALLPAFHHLSDEQLRAAAASIEAHRSKVRDMDLNLA